MLKKTNNNYIMKKKINSEIIADSINENGDRITTFILTLPRIVLAELNTHRKFSRNSSSSRAIPLKKMINNVYNDPFIPIAWQKDHSGMQGTEYFEGNMVKLFRFLWVLSSLFAIAFAWTLNKIGLTKQLCNRILEPYSWHTVIVTSTDYENFFALRSHPDAEIHIKELSDNMLFKYNHSLPKKLTEGEWHIPFGGRIDESKASRELGHHMIDKDWSSTFNLLKIKIATARCARVSYENFLGKDNYLNDIKLHDRLSKVGHWSPFEHCAFVPREQLKNEESGNFTGFVQYRKTFEGENKIDNRVIK